MRSCVTGNRGRLSRRKSQTCRHPSDCVEGTRQGTWIVGGGAVQLSGVLLTTVVHGLFLSPSRSVSVVATDSFEIPRKPTRINARRARRSAPPRKSAATNKHASGRRLITAHLCSRTAHCFRSCDQSAWCNRQWLTVLWVADDTLVGCSCR